MNKPILHIGLDVHAQAIAIAVAEAGSEARLYGSISSDLHSVDKFLAKVRKAHPEAQLRFCYEAGPTGFVLVPTETSSGTKRKQGGISKTGNCHARWIMIEASHHYRLEPGVNPQLSRRQEGLSEEVKACAWKAQTRLHKRLKQLLARGKHRNKAQVAVARELTGFVWQIFRLMEGRMKKADGQQTAESGVKQSAGT